MQNLNGNCRNRRNKRGAGDHFGRGTKIPLRQCITMSCDLRDELSLRKSQKEDLEKQLDIVNQRILDLEKK